MSRDIIYLVIGSSYGRMAQLVVPTGTFVGKHMVAWLSW